GENRIGYGMIVRDDEFFISEGGRGFIESRLLVEEAKCMALEESIKVDCKLNIKEHVLFETGHVGLVNILRNIATNITIIDWELYRIAGDSVLQQRVEESEDPKEEEKEEDPTKIEPLQSVETPDKAEPMEPEAEPDVTTPIFRTKSPCPDLQDELSKLMDTM
ncbi:hypothetical protein J1N35_037631, partial [Gossypium stocksii]